MFDGLSDAYTYLIIEDYFRFQSLAQIQRFVCMSRKKKKAILLHHSVTDQYIKKDPKAKITKCRVLPDNLAVCMHSNKEILLHAMQPGTGMVMIDFLFPHIFERMVRKKKYKKMTYKQLKHFIEQDKNKARFIDKHYF